MVSVIFLNSPFSKNVRSQTHYSRKKFSSANFLFLAGRDVKDGIFSFSLQIRKLFPGNIIIHVRFLSECVCVVSITGSSNLISSSGAVN